MSKKENKEGMTYGEIETLLRIIQQGGPLSRMKSDNSLPEAMKMGIYRVIRKLQNSSEIQAYQDRKQDLATTLEEEKKRLDKLVQDKELTAKDSDEELQKFQATIDAEFRDLLQENSGFVLEKTKIPETTALRILTIDEMVICDPIFEYTSKEDVPAKKKRT
jgi:hypothetical protein